MNIVQQEAVVSIPEAMLRMLGDLDKIRSDMRHMKDLHTALERIGNGNPVRLAKVKGASKLLGAFLTDEGFAKELEKVMKETTDPLSREAAHVGLALNLGREAGKVRARLEKLDDRAKKGAGSSGEAENLKSMLAALGEKECGLNGKIGVCLNGYAQMRKTVLELVDALDKKVMGMFPGGSKALRDAVLANSCVNVIGDIENNERTISFGKQTGKGARI